MVRQEPGGVVLALHRCFAQEDERPGYVQIMWRMPFQPNPFEGLPGALGHGTLQETVLRRFFDVCVANLAMRREAHGPEPSSNGKSFVKGEPDEGPHLARAGAVPNSGS
ncbi:unnamed protein product [Sphagnum troendelagicum]|uniref:Uncharacterized protein n=1 Tax=Sphagnum troendelagicum TaxID=128251 RepID=A0ABP0TRW1_9BRYO